MPMVYALSATKHQKKNKLKKFIDFHALYHMLSIKIKLPTIIFIAFFTLSFHLCIAQQDVKPNFIFKTIVIDAGHGGKDPGAHGDYSFEKNVTLAIALKVQALAKKKIVHIKTIMTRSTDEFIELNQRSEIANKNYANLFISIHCNSSPEGTKKIANKEKGVLLLVYGYHRKEEQMEALRENASIYIEKDYQAKYAGYTENDPSNLIILNTMMAKYRKQSILFGELLNQQFTDNNGRGSRGVKEQGVLVLAHSGMPAVLIETGYINNPDEEKYLNSEDGQNEIAASIVNAIIAYRDKISTK